MKVKSISVAAIVTFLLWFVCNLPWQGLGIGILAGLILYERMTRHAAREADRGDRPEGKPETEKEIPIFGLPPPS